MMHVVALLMLRDFALCFCCSVLVLVIDSLRQSDFLTSREKDEGESSLCVTPALPPSDELQSGCSECRHLLTDENAQLFDSCPNCKRLLNSKINNNSKNCKFKA